MSVCFSALMKGYCAHWEHIVVIPIRVSKMEKCEDGHK